MANGVVNDMEDLIGLPDPTKGKTERAARVLEQLITHRRTERDGEEAPPTDYKGLNEADVRHGVTVGLLSQIFGMDPTTIKKKLKDCPPLFRRKAGFVYDLKVASQYLVTPVFNAEDYLKTMKASELPTHLQDEYWAAQLKRQKWEENAGHLWRTESVVEVLGAVMQKIKFTMQLWPDNVERALGLSHEQRMMLLTMSDEMMKEVHAALLQMPDEKKTPPIMAEIQINGTALAAPPIDRHADDVANLI